MPRGCHDGQAGRNIPCAQQPQRPHLMVAREQCRIQQLLACGLQLLACGLRLIACGLQLIKLRQHFFDAVAGARCHGSRAARRRLSDVPLSLRSKRCAKSANREAVRSAAHGRDPQASTHKHAAALIALSMARRVPIRTFSACACRGESGTCAISFTPGPTGQAGCRNQSPSEEHRRCKQGEQPSTLWLTLSSASEAGRQG